MATLTLQNHVMTLHKVQILVSRVIFVYAFDVLIMLNERFNNKKEQEVTK